MELTTGYQNSKQLMTPGFGQENLQENKAVKVGWPMAILRLWREACQIWTWRRKKILGSILRQIITKSSAKPGSHELKKLLPARHRNPRTKKIALIRVIRGWSYVFSVIHALRTPRPGSLELHKFSQIMHRNSKEQKICANSYNSWLT